MHARQALYQLGHIHSSLVMYFILTLSLKSHRRHPISQKKLSFLETCTLAQDHMAGKEQGREQRRQERKHLRGTSVQGGAGI